jgi:peptide/nickel transport system substrate-binding protein
MLKYSAIRPYLAPTVATVLIAVAATMPGSAQAQSEDKHITIVMPAEPPDLEGCQSSRAFQGRVVKQNIVETLVWKTPSDGSLKPHLATSWELADVSNWRIHLRHGVKFHDGSPFNATTLKRSMDRTINNKEIVCGDRGKFFGSLKVTISVVDDDTINIHTTPPAPIMPMRLAALAIVGPNESMTSPSLAPVGTGPYKFDSWAKGQEIKLARNEDYWGAKPEATGASYIFRSESTVRASMAELGEADVAIVISEQDANNPKTDYSYLNSETTFLRVDSQIPPLDDIRVRKALNYALDRKGMIGTILPSSALQATQIVMPSIPGHNHELDKKAIPFDPVMAKKLLAEAKADGVPVDTEIQLISYPPHFPNASELMDAYYLMLRDVGFNVKMLTVEPGTYSHWNNKPHPSPRPPTLIQSSHDNNFGDPVFSVYFKFSCAGNTSAMCDPEFDKKILNTQKLGGQERIDGYKELFRHQYEDLVTSVFMYHMVGFTRVNPRIDFVPDVTSNAELRIAEWHFK